MCARITCIFANPYRHSRPAFAGAGSGVNPALNDDVMVSFNLPSFPRRRESSG
jgi:hypothetical protein